MENGNEEEEMSDEEADDPRKKEMRIARSKRRKMRLLKESEASTTRELFRAKDKREVGKRVMSGGPKKVSDDVPFFVSFLLTGFYPSILPAGVGAPSRRVHSLELFSFTFST